MEGRSASLCASFTALALSLNFLWYWLCGSEEQTSVFPPSLHIPILTPDFTDMIYSVLQSSQGSVKTQCMYIVTPPTSFRTQGFSPISLSYFQHSRCHFNSLLLSIPHSMLQDSASCIIPMFTVNS